MRTCVICGRELRSASRHRACTNCFESILFGLEGMDNAWERAGMEIFRMEYTHCWLCGCGWRDCDGNFRRLEIHHILGGVNRSHVRENLSMLCTECHRLVHARQVLLAHTLWLKRERDRPNYRRAVLERIRGSSLPVATEPPEQYKAMWERNNPATPWERKR